MATNPTPITLAAGDGREISLGPSRFVVKAGTGETGGACTVMEYVALPSAGSTWHTHTREDEAFYVLEGTLTFRLGEESFEAGPGSYVFLPRGVRHSFVNRGRSNVRALIVATPGGLEGYFAEAAALLTKPGVTQADLGALNAKYGLEFE